MPSIIMSIKKTFGYTPTIEEITHNASRRIRQIEGQQPELANVLRAALKEVERAYLFLAWSANTRLLQEHAVHWAEVTSKSIKVLSRRPFDNMDRARGLLNELGKMHLLLRVEPDLFSSTVLDRIVVQIQRNEIPLCTTLTHISTDLLHNVSTPLDRIPPPSFVKSDASIKKEALDILFGRKEMSPEMLFEAGKIFDKEGDRNWVSFDQARALSLYEKCGTYSPAEERRSEIYFEQANSSKKTREKLELLQAASDLGHIEATYELATSITDKKKSIKLLTSIPLSDRKTFPAYHFEMFLLKMDDNSGGDNYKAAQAYLTGDFEGKKVREDIPLGIDYLKKAAEKGYDQANIELGRRYYEGDGVKADIHLALACYEKGHTYQANLWVQILKDELKGDANALLTHAINFVRGQNGFELNIDKAFKYFKLSADLGNWIAQYELGVVYLGWQWYEKTLITQPDYNQAKHYLSLACNSSNKTQPLYPKALARLAFCYQNLNERALRVEYAKKSADLGDPLGQYYLAECYCEEEGLSLDSIRRSIQYFTFAKSKGTYVDSCNQYIQKLENLLQLKLNVQKPTIYSPPTNNYQPSYQQRNYLNSPPPGFSGSNNNGMETFGNMLNAMQTSFENNLDNYGQFRQNLYNYNGQGPAPMFIPPPTQDFGFGGF